MAISVSANPFALASLSAPLLRSVLSRKPKLPKIRPARDFRDADGGDFSVTRIDFEVVFDLLTEQTTTFEADVTDNAIEDGSTVSDHIHARPSTVRLEGIISENEIQFLSGIRTSGDRIRDAYKVLAEIAARRLVVDVETARRTYRNHAIVSFSERIDPETDTVLACQIGIKELKFVRTKSATVRPPAPGASLRELSGTETKGLSAKTAAGTALSDKTQSALGSALPSLPGINLFEDYGVAAEPAAGGQ